jgi:hypothetical protein
VRISLRRGVAVAGCDSRNDEKNHDFAVASHATAKTVNDRNKRHQMKNQKTDGKTAVAVALVFFAVVQLYRVLKSLCKSAYCAQGELTICAVRKAEVCEGDKEYTGNAVCFGVDSKRGAFAASGVKLAENAIGLNASKIAIRFAQKLHWFTDVKAFCAFIVKEGELLNIDGRKMKAVGFVGGSSINYVFAVDGGKLRRIETRKIERVGEASGYRNSKWATSVSK